tara:strand:+ start:80 stop:502 length:423 start_codon:yes stop_codon:yes gene_type:complete
MKKIIAIIKDKQIRGINRNKCEIKMTMRTLDRTIAEVGKVIGMNKNILEINKTTDKKEKEVDNLLVQDEVNNLNKIMMMTNMVTCKMIIKIKETTIECMMIIKLRNIKDKVEKINSVSLIKTSVTEMKMSNTMKMIIVLN